VEEEVREEESRLLRVLRHYKSAMKALLRYLKRGGGGAGDEVTSFKGFKALLRRC
jgi:hypothetical protein